MKFVFNKICNLPCFCFLLFKNLFSFSCLVLGSYITVFVTDGSTDAGEFFGIDVQGPSTSNFIDRNLHSNSCTYVTIMLI